MKGQGRAARLVGGGLSQESPLRGYDPRAKLALCLSLAIAVMAPLVQLLVLLLIAAGLLAWARLLGRAARQIWRLKVVLILLFLVDWLVIGYDLAVIVTVRLVLLAVVFVLFFATTTPTELCLALERLRLPYRYAFSLGLAFESLTFLDDEWRAVREAQMARGIGIFQAGWRSLLRQIGNLVGLAVPAVVLTAKRAWSATEAAYARGFDSPNRRPYRQLAMRGHDWLMLAGAVVTPALVLWWR